MPCRWLPLLVLGLVAGCKSYDEPRKLDQACKTDKDCEDPLVCRKGLRPTAVCLKTCGTNKFGKDSTHYGVGEPDTSCPAGWECAATLEHRLVDKLTKEDRGAAYDGAMDQPICVPKGWTPAVR